MILKEFQNQRFSWITPRFIGIFFMICCATIISFGGLIYRNFEDIEILEIVKKTPTMNDVFIKATSDE